VPSASQLFADASEARRAGDVETAIVLYQRLCAEYPSSVEAGDAKVLMGNLLLSQRSPRAALREFEGYGSGALTAEALWGQAQALRKLGSPDERAVLERLARDYASSPYAGAAQKRLQELVR
jgi:TolA-binding protein